MVLSISEETALLAVDHDLVYTRFSERKKKTILALISSYAFMHLIIGQSIRLAIPQIASDFNTQPSVVGLSIGLWLFAACLSGLTGGAYSTHSGRRPVQLVGASLLCLGSTSVGFSTSIPAFMVSRIIEGFGAGYGVYVGSAVIGDIYQPERRGHALGVLRSVSCMGLVLALPVNGFITTYTSWRAMQLCLGVMGGLIFILMFISLPETIHPDTRVIDELPPSSGSLKFRVINPLKPLVLLRSPNLLAVSFMAYTTLVTESILTIPLAYTFGPKYKVTAPTIISACLALAAIGGIVGASLAGIISDRAVVKWKARRSGTWHPEDRLRVTLPATLGGVPSSILIFALVVEYVPGYWIGLSLCLLCLFMNGVMTEFVMGPSIAYLVDLMHERSAEAVAAASTLSIFLLSFTTAWIFPLIETLGLVGASFLVAFLSWAGHLVLWYMIRYGDRMRTWVDIDYSMSR